jgi:hypothetical protein
MSYRTDERGRLRAKNDHEHFHWRKKRTRFFLAHAVAAIPRGCLIVKITTLRQYKARGSFQPKAKIKTAPDELRRGRLIKLLSRAAYGFLKKPNGQDWKK